MPYTPPPWTSRNGRSYRTITQYDTRHLSVLVLVIVLCGVLVVAARRLPRSTVRAARKVAGAVLAICAFAYYAWVLSPSRIVWDETAPFHITDLLRLITPLALLTDNPAASALSYYWGFLLNPMALLFPDMAYVTDRPGLQEFAYWFFHCAALVVPTVLTFALGYRPTWKDFRLTTALSLTWAIFAAQANRVTGGNYVFLAGYPRGWSILQLMGRWPYYIPVAVGGVIGGWAAMTWLWPRNRRSAAR